MKRTEAFLAALSDLLNSTVAALWRKDMREMVEGKSIPERLAVRATLEALVRDARKRGWIRRYTSKTKKTGRATSRYLHRDGQVVRISDHVIPMNEARAERYAQRGAPRRRDVIVTVDLVRTRSIAEWRAVIDHPPSEEGRPIAQYVLQTYLLPPKRQP